ncbi:hypothetical protein ACFTXM_46440 [Streptomyces sp. NPDC056930]|uniref:hypothetical protein n=1 Tax=Streptomyces sp. NPDC056930 TaxID=3345967 RepID=UPI00363EB504
MVRSSDLRSGEDAALPPVRVSVARRRQPQRLRVRHTGRNAHGGRDRTAGEAGLQRERGGRLDQALLDQTLIVLQPLDYVDGVGCGDAAR